MDDNHSTSPCRQRPSVAVPAQMLFVSSATNITILELNDDLGVDEVGFYDSMITFGNPTSVAYSGEYDELAFSVAAEDPLTKGRVYVVSSVDDWVA